MIEENAVFSFVESRVALLHQTIRQHPINPTLKVSVITPTNKEIYAENIFNNYARQTYPNKELIIILNNNSLDIREWQKRCQMYPHAHVYQLDESVTLGECLNYAVDHSTGDFVAKLDDDDYYGPYYLLDHIRCFQTTDAAVVGKVGHFVYFEELDRIYYYQPGDIYKYVDYLTGGTHVIRRDVFDRVRFQPFNAGEDFHFNHECNLHHLKLYAADPFNYLRYRKTDKDLHTWRITDQEYIAWCAEISEVEEPRQFVTV